MDDTVWTLSEDGSTAACRPVTKVLQFLQANIDNEERAARASTAVLGPAPPAPHPWPRNLTALHPPRPCSSWLAISHGVARFPVLACA
jgi:hypothetical protein